MASLITNTVKPGTISAYAGTTAPSGYLICDGTAVSRATYAGLFAAIGCVYGAGDGSTTFNLPDFRGRFVRGFDNGAARDPDRSSRTYSGASDTTFTLTGGVLVSGNSLVTVSNTASLTPGMVVTGSASIPASTVVRTINSSTTFTMGNLANTANVNATGSASGLTLTFTTWPHGNYQGTAQGGAYENHRHTGGYSMSDGNSNQLGGAFGNNASYANAYAPNTGYNINRNPAYTTIEGTSTETRPINISANYIIKI